MRTLGSKPLEDRTILLFEFLFFSTWYCLRLFCTASNKDIKVFFNSFSYSNSSRSANSDIKVSENSRISTSSSKYNSFNWDRLKLLNSAINKKYYYLIKWLKNNVVLSSYKGELNTSFPFSRVSFGSLKDALDDGSKEGLSSCIISSISWMTSSAVFKGSVSWCSPPNINACMSRSLATASSSELRSSRSSSGDNTSWIKKKLSELLRYWRVIFYYAKWVDFGVLKIIQYFVKISLITL